jgi:hypothetical protein
MLKIYEPAAVGDPAAVKQLYGELLEVTVKVVAPAGLPYRELIDQAVPLPPTPAKLLTAASFIEIAAVAEYPN